MISHRSAGILNRDEGKVEREGKIKKTFQIKAFFFREVLFSVSHISNIVQQWNGEMYLAHYLSATNVILQQCFTHLSPPDRLSVSPGTS